MRHRLLFAMPALAALALSVWWLWPSGQVSELSSTSAASFYATQVEPVLGRRCLACHGCYSSPCQLNFQSADGATRGAFKVDVLNGSRLKSVQPTRLGVDARGKAGWQKLGFFEVNANGIMREMLELKQKHAGNFTTDRPDRENRSCPSNAAEMTAYAALHPEGGMPYGLPPLASDEFMVVQKWLESGAPVEELSAQDTLASLTAHLSAEVSRWQEFLNGVKPRERLVARYIYEHLFLAHLYFNDSPGRFFRLIRSRSECTAGATEIATPRPNDDPGVERPYYCLMPVTEKVVEKNHMPFALGPERLERWKKLFFGSDWDAKAMPSYELRVASNPFLAFQEIPARARYQFLLEDARYHVSTFIKGPVCNGSVAVNSIQEQFYVFFLDPEADPLVKNDDFGRKNIGLLELPGGWGRDINPIDLPFRFHESIEVRNRFREQRVAAGRALRPRGYSFSDIWDGNGANSNALLTVFRHNESAFVLQGARGDLSKTAFVVDYSIFERLVYNLVVNFDVFANVGHQLMTRGYMTLIRMEAEELFLQFLPSAERKGIRAQWYQGPFTTLEMTFLYPLIGLEQESGIAFKDPRNAKAEFVNRVLFERFDAKVRGPSDAINWRLTTPPVGLPAPTAEQGHLRALTGLRAESADFPKLFPDFTLLEVVGKKGPERLYSFIINKEMLSLAWIFQENNRRAPLDDSLLVLEGLAGSYPNLFLRVNEAEFADFKNAVLALHTQEDWSEFVARYGVARTRADFWKVYDEMQSLVNRYQGVESGVLDLSRYE